MRRGLLLAVLAAATFAAPPTAAAGQTEVVALLDGPPLARAVAASRALSSTYKSRRLSLTAPTSVAYLRTLARRQAEVARRIAHVVPDARIRWRYRIVANGLAVVLPESRVGALRGVPGVADVLLTSVYGSALDRSAGEIGAPTLWGPDYSTAGQGVKIAILDDGVDQRHPFFAPSRYAPPAGFPKGQTAYTTAKVIVARAFPPASPTWRHASKPVDPELSGHGTHVAGIAAGNAETAAIGRRILSGVAPRAYVGNYKVLTIPAESGVGLNGNAAEIVAGVEAAVADGMDVINLSLGEPEIEPTRDIVAAALDRASDAGVVVTVAAGNDGGDFGGGSIGSPGSAAKAITVGAALTATDAARFSSIAPTPLSLRMKPELAAPGVEVVSSIPQHDGEWAAFSGTSMAAPHVAGAAALLLQRHQDWTPAQVKSALVQTAVPMPEARTTRVGAGLVAVPRADRPLVFANPTAVSFGLIRRGQRAVAAIELTDAGGGAGTWAVSLDPTSGAGLTLTAPATALVPGRLELVAAADAQATARTVAGAITLRNGAEVRRIPFWLRVTNPRLGRHRATPLQRPGVYTATNAGRPRLVNEYRYPEGEFLLGGPERVFRVTIARPVSNFGVAIVGRAPGVRVVPRIAVAGDENRLVGYTSLPFNLNPWLATFGQLRLAAGAIRPARGSYDVVFDSPAVATAGRFSFRFWVDDVTPPRLRLLTASVRPRQELRVRVTDGGSGVDPQSVIARVGGDQRQAWFRNGLVTVETDGLAPGRHRLVLQVSDFQETRNMENVARILPNTGRLTAAFTVTR